MRTSATCETLAAIATWMMEACGVNQAVAGDLLEEFEAGRSSAWFLWQVAGAITARIGGCLHHRKAVIQISGAMAVLLLMHSLPSHSVASVLAAWILLYACCGFGIVLLDLAREAHHAGSHRSKLPGSRS